MSGGVDEHLIPYDHVKDRCDYVASVKEANDYVIFSSIFTLNVPQRFDDHGFVVSEAFQTHKYFAETHGSHPGKVFLENASFDTIGSIYFSLRLILNLELGASEAIFVTSSFHVLRTRVIIARLSLLLGIELAIRVETPLQERQTDTTMRELHEARQAAKFETLFSGFVSPRDFYHWLYSQHSNYSIHFTSDRIGGNYLY